MIGLRGWTGGATVAGVTQVTLSLTTFRAALPVGAIAARRHGDVLHAFVVGVAANIVAMLLMRRWESRQ